MKIICLHTDIGIILCNHLSKFYTPFFPMYFYCVILLLWHNMPPIKFEGLIRPLGKKKCSAFFIKYVRIKLR